MIRAPRFALLLSATLAIPAQGAVNPAIPAETAHPVEDISELNEVFVRGRLVANALIATEKRVFWRYNTLNKDSRFDVHCGDVMPRLNRDTLAIQHTCVPEFLSRYAPVVHYIPDTGTGFRLETIPGNGEGLTAIVPTTFTRYVRYEIPGSARPVPAALRSEFAQNMQQVFGLDPALKDMAATLAGMYQEMDRTRAHYLKLQQEKRAHQSERVHAAEERARERGRALRPPHPRGT
jgi:hypothetical protein